MSRRERIVRAAGVVRTVSSYNIKIIFANRFVWFLLAAFIFFLGVAAIMFFSSDADPGPGSVYYLLIFPGLLVIFYPTAFGIQNDVDARMIETLFGIPDYRYKVWLARIALIWVIVFAILVVLSALSSVILVRIPVLRMVYQLMYPIFFVGSLAFMFSTVVRSGNGASVLIVAVGMGFWIASEPLRRSKWNLFLNPFDVPTDISEAVWAGIVFDNRVILAVGSALAILAGLYNLQKREKFI